MTEQEYIVACDRRTVWEVQTMLSRIIVVNNPHVKQSEYAKVLKILDSWAESMGKAIKIKP
jgi:hypothetical protein